MKLTLPVRQDSWLLPSWVSFQHQYPVAFWGHEMELGPQPFLTFPGTPGPAWRTRLGCFCLVKPYIELGCKEIHHRKSGQWKLTGGKRAEEKGGAWVNVTNIGSSPMNLIKGSPPPLPNSSYPPCLNPEFTSGQLCLLARPIPVTLNSSQIASKAQSRSQWCRQWNSIKGFQVGKWPDSTCV